jgi:hypothetical protein
VRYVPSIQSDQSDSVQAASEANPPSEKAIQCKELSSDDSDTKLLVFGSDLYPKTGGMEETFGLQEMIFGERVHKMKYLFLFSSFI